MALRDWLLAWIDGRADPRQQPDSLPAVVHYLTDAWRRRGTNAVRLVHYDDLCTDLGGQMPARQPGLTSTSASVRGRSRWPPPMAARGCAQCGPSDTRR